MLRLRYIRLEHLTVYFFKTPTLCEHKIYYIIVSDLYVGARRVVSQSYYCDQNEKKTC